jgi:hypothetical protein
MQAGQEDVNTPYAETREDESRGIQNFSCQTVTVLSGGARRPIEGEMSGCEDKMAVGATHVVWDMKTAIPKSGKAASSTYSQATVPSCGQAASRSYSQAAGPSYSQVAERVPVEETFVEEDNTHLRLERDHQAGQLTSLADTALERR